MRRIARRKITFKVCCHIFWGFCRPVFLVFIAQVIQDCWAFWNMAIPYINRCIYSKNKLGRKENNRSNSQGQILQFFIQLPYKPDFWNDRNSGKETCFLRNFFMFSLTFLFKHFFENIVIKSCSTHNVCFIKFKPHIKCNCGLWVYYDFFGNF